MENAGKMCWLHVLDFRSPKIRTLMSKYVNKSVFITFLNKTVDRTVEIDVAQ